MLSLNNLVLMLYSNEKASLVRLGCVSVSLYVKLVNTGKVNIATLNSIVPHIKRKTPTASCLLSLAHAQNVSVSLKCHSNTDTDTQIWANGKECGEVSTGIYWNGMQIVFFYFQNMMGTHGLDFESEFGDAFAGGCASGLGWFLYGATLSHLFLSKTTLSSLLS